MTPNGFDLVALYLAAEAAAPILVSKAVAALPESLLSAAADKIASKTFRLGWESIRQRLQAGHPDLSNDLQRATRKAYLDATKEMVREALPSARSGTLIGAEREALEQALRAIEAERDQIRDWSPEGGEIPDAAALLLDPDRSAERRRRIRERVAVLLEADFARWHPGAWQIGALQQRWLDGWDTPRGRRDWMDALAHSFIKALEAEPKVAALFQSELLARMAAEDGRLAPVADVKTLVGYFDDLKDEVAAVPERVVEVLEQRGVLRAQAGVRLLPPQPTRFTGRDEIRAWVRERLTPGERVLIHGEPGTGKSTVAIQLAWELQDRFEDLVYQDCGDRPVEEIAGELSRRLGLDLNAVEPSRFAETAMSWFSGRKALLILDDVKRTDAEALLAGTPAAVLITSREKDVFGLAKRQRWEVAGFSRDEADRFFGESLDARYGASKAAILEFAAAGEYLPYAMAAAAGLLNRSTAPPAEAVAALSAATLRYGKLDLPRLLETAVVAQPPEARQLLRAFAVCAPGGAWLDFAVEVAGLTLPGARRWVDDLVNGSLLRLLVAERQKFGLHALLHALLSDAEKGRLDRRHAEVLAERMSRWREDWRASARVIGEVERALGVMEKGERFAGLAFDTYGLGKQTGALAEAYRAMEIVEGQFVAAGDRAGLAQSWGSRALILRAWGRLDEAMALHKQEEEALAALGDREGVGRSWGNQALVLQSWGRLDAAMALHKKEEDVCAAFGDKTGLAASWGNQALILRVWGRLDDAMGLFQKQEEVCAAGGDRVGLAACWGNQALILFDRGRLDEAMRLFKQQEEVCAALGDRAGLQRSWGNQAEILDMWGRQEEAMALLKQQEEVCAALGDRAGLQRSWGNQALILADWGRLEEAMALHRREEMACTALGDRSGLQACWGNQALILIQWERLDEAMGLLKKQEELCSGPGDRAGLSRSWGNQALILKRWERLDEALALHLREAGVCGELGDSDGRARSLVNQAAIHKRRGEMAEWREKLEKAQRVFLDAKLPGEVGRVEAELREGGDASP
jgi:tetratricopeptide (TPR) repeat protein